MAVYAYVYRFIFRMIWFGFKEAVVSLGKLRAISYFSFESRRPIAQVRGQCKGRACIPFKTTAAEREIRGHS